MASRAGPPPGDPAAVSCRTHCEQPYHMYYLLLPSLEAGRRLIAHLGAQGSRRLPLPAAAPLRHGPAPSAAGRPVPVTEDVSDRLVRLPFYVGLGPQRAGRGDRGDRRVRVSRAMTAARRAARERVEDVAFVVLVASLPVVLFVSGLGFYLDDYARSPISRPSDEQSFWSEYARAARRRPEVAVAPARVRRAHRAVPALRDEPASLSDLHGCSRPGVRGDVVLVLHRLTRDRYVALGVAVLFALAPHYSSARFWVVAFSPIAVLTLFLASLYCVLRALESRGARLFSWVAAGCVAIWSSASSSTKSHCRCSCSPLRSSPGEPGGARSGARVSPPSSTGPCSCSRSPSSSLLRCVSKPRGATRSVVTRAACCTTSHT